MFPLMVEDYSVADWLVFFRTADINWLRNHWSAIQKQIQFSSSFVNPETQLWAPLNVFKGAPNGTAPSSQFVWTLHNMANLADSLGDSNSSAIYRQQANATAQAINQYLWNPTTGTYKVSLTDGNYSYIDSTCYTANAAP
jgi:hypothetical protein